MINEIDKQILNIIQKDARIANAEIARQVGLAPSAVMERVRKLEERGIIRGYATAIDAAQVGFGLTAFVFVRTSVCGELDETLAKIPEVLEVHDVAGEDCLSAEGSRQEYGRARKSFAREAKTDSGNYLDARRPSFCKPLRKQRRCRWIN